MFPRPIHPPPGRWAAFAPVAALWLLTLSGCAPSPDEGRLREQLAPTAAGPVDLPGARLPGALLTKEDLTGANLAGADLEEAVLTGAKLAGADLSHARLDGADLRGADLTGAHLEGATLKAAELSDARLDAADLRGAQLAAATLRDARLGGARLAGADLGSANLQFAGLQRADLSEASLRHATLARADLQGARLDGADLRGADLAKAALAGVTARGARYDSGTRPARPVELLRTQGAREQPPAPARTLAAIAILLAGAFFAARRVDVRLVLAACAVALFALAGQFVHVFGQVAQQMTNDKTVVPICSAMGFAYVLKLTGCDEALIWLLLRPLRRVRPLLIPGGIAVGYLVNTAIVSQSSTAAAVGPVLVPLLLAAGVSPVTAGAALLLGSSMGGELFNPGAVEIVTLAEQTGRTSAAVVSHVLRPNLLASGAALLLFWILAVRAERPTPDRGAPAQRAMDPRPPETGDDRVVPTAAGTPAGPAIVHPQSAGRSALKAVVPLLPLAILFVAPHLLRFPKDFALEGRTFDTNSVSILAAMLAGVVAAGLVAPRRIGELPRAFIEGAGYAYVNVIFLIVTATIFTEGIKANGLIEAMTRLLAGRPLAAQVASVSVPWLLAMITGSGIASAVAVIKVLVPAAPAMHLDPLGLGGLIAVAAQFGRTMSPIAAVAIMAAAISNTTPGDLVRRVAPALLGGLGVLLLAALLGLL